MGFMDSTSKWTCWQAHRLPALGMLKAGCMRRGIQPQACPLGADLLPLSAASQGSGNVCGSIPQLKQAVYLTWSALQAVWERHVRTGRIPQLHHLFHEKQVGWSGAG